MAKPKILFVCVENSCRSQMAEAFGRLYGGEGVEVRSAGSQPSGVVNPKAIASMAERGLDMSQQRSKGLDQVPAEGYAAVVSMGCGEACPQVGTLRREDWAIPDPKHMNPEGFREVRDEIESKVRELLAAL